MPQGKVSFDLEELEPAPFTRSGLNGAWFHENPQARKMLEDWLEKAAAGTTAVAFSRLHAALYAGGMPCNDVANFRTWIQRHYGGDRYKAAIKGSTRARNSG